MADETFRVLELSLQGFKCSQILALMALEAQGKSSPELVRATSGLLGGMGCGGVCGCLTGGCCALGLYAGRGAEDEQEDADLPDMLTELVRWFETDCASRYGGTTCEEISRMDPDVCRDRCPGLIVETFAKVQRILARYGYRPDGGRETEGEA